MRSKLNAAHLKQRVSVVGPLFAPCTRGAWEPVRQGCSESQRTQMAAGSSSQNMAGSNSPPRRRNKCQPLSQSQLSTVSKITSLSDQRSWSFHNSGLHISAAVPQRLQFTEMLASVSATAADGGPTSSNTSDQQTHLDWADNLRRTADFWRRATSIYLSYKVMLLFLSFELHGDAALLAVSVS
jgi:hypothetical protein